MEYDIIYYLKKRYTTKAYDSSKKIPDEYVTKIKDLLRFSPSSTNIQPWHFILASTDEGKAKIAKATEKKYKTNTNSILYSSHVVVFCTKLEADKEHILKVLEQEDRDHRFAAGEEFKERNHLGRQMFVNLHKYDYKDIQHWMDKQVYLNIGQFLLGVATLGIDATPMEGIDTKVIDEEFGLRDKGYTSLVLVTLGYRDTEKDFNIKLRKSRLPFSDILTEI